MLCAALFKCMRSALCYSFGNKRPVIKKQQMNPANPLIAEEKETKETDKETPTMQETWQKVIDLEWKSLNRADAWNLGKSIGGTLSVFAIMLTLYLALEASCWHNPPAGPAAPDMPYNPPVIIIPEIP